MSWQRPARSTGIFSKGYADGGRPSIAPERLLRDGPRRILTRASPDDDIAAFGGLPDCLELAGDQVGNHGRRRASAARASLS
jgi:hypothetical protein